jgi:hypothetical protein
VIATASNRRSPLTAAVRRQIVERAGAFVRQRYRMDAAAAAALMALPVVWRRGGGRSAFYPRPCRGHAGPHIVLRIPRGAYGRWCTYRRVRARLSTPREGIELPIDLLLTVVLIHEFTHAVQHGVCGGTPRRFSEVETTENEIEFVRVHAPAAHARLVAVEGAPRTPSPLPRTPALPGRFGPRPPGSRPAGLRAVALRLLRDIWVRYQVAAFSMQCRAAP